MRYSKSFKEIATFSFKMFKIRFKRSWKSLKTIWNSPVQFVVLTQKLATEVVYNMRVLKYFAPWDIFWFGSINTLCPLGYILVWSYWNILPLEVLKHFRSRLIKILNYNFMLNWFKYFNQKNQTIFMLKIFQYPHTKLCLRGQYVSIPPNCTRLWKHLLLY